LNGYGKEVVFYVKLPTPALSVSGI